MTKLIIVTASNGESHSGDLYLFEKKQTWIPFIEKIPVVLGKSGMAWGVGLYPKGEAFSSIPIKKEGDRRSPAGCFSLGTAFGAKQRSLNVPYLHLHPNREVVLVDDPKSIYYNQIIERKKNSEADWSSCEKMEKESLYELGLVINHNYPHPQAGAGSGIFMHVWRNEHTGTAGCTAMSLENLVKVLSWVDLETKIVQLPLELYMDFQEKWKLPKLF